MFECSGYEVTSGLPTDGFGDPVFEFAAGDAGKTDTLQSF
jgi:hypothetical protein